MSDSIIIRKVNESDLEEILVLINAPEADNGITRCKYYTHDL